MDRETVITHLQLIHTWAESARKCDLQFFTAKLLEDIAQWTGDAIALLKEQETHKFFVDESGKITPLPVVVRCKDCKHGRQYDTNAIDCEYRELATEPDWFCADGERK